MVDVNDVLGQLTPALKRLIGTDRRLVINPAPGQVRVRADRGQIDQVLINLVANARDATGTDGLVSVEAHAVELDRSALES